MALKKSDDKSTKNAPLGKDSRTATGLVGVYISILINLHTFREVAKISVLPILGLALARVFWRSKMVIGGAMALW